MEDGVSLLINSPEQIFTEKLKSLDSNGESEETTTYTYTLDNRGIVTSCHAVVRHIRNGYEQDYTRTVNYTIE